MLRRAVRQQAQLHLSRHLQVLLQPLLLLRDPLVQPRVFNRDRDLRGQRRQRALMVLVEGVRAGMLKLKHADDAVFINKRHDQLRACFRVFHVVASILADVRYMHQPPFRDRHAHQPSTDRQPLISVHRLPESRCEPAFQHPVILVRNPDGEKLKVHQPPDQLVDAREQRFRLENRGELARDLVEHPQRLRLARHPRVQSRILDRLRNPRCCQCQQVQVLRPEVVQLFAFHVEHADQVAFDNQRHGQLRAHVRVGLDVVVRQAHVVDQHGLARFRDPAHNAFAEGQAHPLGFAIVPDLEPHAKIAGAVVHQKNGKDAKVKHRANHLGGLPQQRS